MTLGVVCSDASNLAGGRSDWALSEASRLANVALEMVQSASGMAHKPREAIAISSTTSGGNRITLPTDFDFPIAFTLYQGSTSTNTQSRTTVSVPLIQKDAAWLDAQPAQFIGGVPQNYLWYSTWLELFPSPNSAYSLQLRYGITQVSLITSTETAQLSTQWNQAWVYKTAELMAASRGDAANEALNQARYVNYVKTLDTDRAKAQRDRRSQTMRPGMASNLRNGGVGRAD